MTPDAAPTPAKPKRAKAPKAAAAPKAKTVDESIAHLHDLIRHQMDEDQAEEPVSIPLAGKSSIADYMIVATGRSTRHVTSMADKLAQRIKQETGRIARIEGLPNADWVLLDAGDIIVHLFRAEVRGFYNLERMWSFGDAPGADTAN